MFSSCVLKKALPFTLTLLVGAALGQAFNSFSSGSEVQTGIYMHTGTTKKYGCDYRRKFRASRQQMRTLPESSAPVPVFEPNTKYTREAWERQVTGVVRLRLTVGTQGRVTNVEVLDGLPYGLTEEAVRVARQSHFMPASKDGEPVVATRDMDYVFSLNDRMAAGL
jgi:TonB family protein